MIKGRLESAQTMKVRPDSAQKVSASQDMKRGGTPDPKLIKQIENLEKVIVKQQQENRDLQKKINKQFNSEKLREELITKQTFVIENQTLQVKKA